MDKVLTSVKMEMFILATSKQIYLMEKVLISGQMEIVMKGPGKKI